MRSYRSLLCSAWLAAVLLGSALAACVDEPFAPTGGVARLITVWDPLACGEPHRIVVEIEDDEGDPRSASAPCNLGGVAIDVAHFGAYRGRIYAWAPAAAIRSITPLALTIDQPIVHWFVATPR
jgi:hypothetical protein